jgi:UrcA family protein
METSNLPKNIALFVLALLIIACFALRAHAGESDVGSDRRSVHYQDLNLNSTAGAKVLYLRIREAAHRVCGDVNSRHLEEASAAKACVDRAIMASIRAVNSPQLTRTANTQGYPVETRFEVALQR